MMLLSLTYDPKNTNTLDNNIALKEQNSRQIAIKLTVDQNENDDDDNKVIPNFNDTNKDPNTWSAKVFTAPGIIPLGYVCLVINRRLELN
jgi:hypothetical protein